MALTSWEETKPSKNIKGRSIYEGAHRNRESGTRKMIMTMAATILVVLIVVVMVKVIMMMISNKGSYGDGNYWP